mmetsp:Transcript_30101/g.40192  ORF Transcript_30101/g.40192 Transcript_30101/m.40192 type:complete len:203 (+) Transcript_30101:105-713(+)
MKSRVEHSKSKYGVRFNPRATLISLMDVPDSSVLTDKERCDGWYSVNELKNFRREAQEASRRIIHQTDRRHPNAVPNHPHVLAFEKKECIRGLEYHIDSQRYTRKKTVLRLILEYQHRLNDRASYQATRVANQESRLAHASKKLSSWANDIARSTGYRDFLEAYPEIQIPTSDLMNHMSISDIEHSNEKHVHSNGEVICPNA